jgi:hypothetical protein
MVVLLAEMKDLMLVDKMVLLKVDKLDRPLEVMLADLTDLLEAMYWAARRVEC